MGALIEKDLLNSRYTIAIGPGTVARGTYATAIGDNARAIGDGASSLGLKAWMYHDVFKALLDSRPEHITPKRLEILEELAEGKRNHPEDRQAEL